MSMPAKVLRRVAGSTGGEDMGGEAMSGACSGWKRGSKPAGTPTSARDSSLVAPSAAAEGTTREWCSGVSGISPVTPGEASNPGGRTGDSGLTRRAREQQETLGRGRASRASGSRQNRGRGRRRSEAVPRALAAGVRGGVTSRTAASDLIGRDGGGLRHGHGRERRKGRVHGIRAPAPAARAITAAALTILALAITRAPGQGATDPVAPAFLRAGAVTSPTEVD